MSDLTNTIFESRKLLYIAGPIGAESRYREYERCLQARHWAYLCMMAGAAVYCPHFTYLVGLVDILPRTGFLGRDLEILRRCDALLLVGAWGGSEGCRLEKKEAERVGVPVFTSIAEMREWLKEAK